MPALRFPYRSFLNLFHVGTLDSRNRRQDAFSLEGPCLSVSEHPEAWCRIARLGGLPVWRLTRKNNRFIDVHRLPRATRNGVAAWAVENRWARRATVWQAWTTDEDGSPCYTQHENREAAELEVHEPVRDDGQPSVQPVQALVATPQLLAWASQPRIEPGLVFDFALMAYAQRELDVDGLFWNEELDPAALSAPRAGILPDRVAHWDAQPRTSD